MVQQSRALRKTERGKTTFPRSCTSTNNCSYAAANSGIAGDEPPPLLRRRATTINPISPEPNSQAAAGMGTVVGSGVQPSTDSGAVPNENDTLLMVDVEVIPGIVSVNMALFWK